VTLAECCFSSLNRAAFGANIDISGDYPAATRLFSETPSRIVISFDESALGEIEEIVAATGCSMTQLGKVGSDRLRIVSRGEEVILLDVPMMENAWRSSLKEKLRAEVLAAGAE
jgi:phosphoribosylformylglycinamidine (FGAM) synthase-like enzyme